MNKNILIRVDSGRRIGMGHLMRCRNLAESFTKTKVTFISKEHDHHLIDILDSSSYSIIRLQPNLRHTLTSDSSTWLGDTVEGELDQLIPQLFQIPEIDLLIIDHYGIDHRWEIEIKKRLPKIKKILVIDDLHDRKHVCDYLFDYTYRTDNPYQKKKLVPEDCQTFLGLKYVLLNQLFHQRRQESLTTTTTTTKRYRINISFGGSDLHNVTYQITKVLIPIFGNQVDYVFDIILGNLYKPESCYQLKKLTQSYVNFNIYQSLNYQEITEILSQTDLAIGAGGVSVYERCCLGIPSVIITLAENQEQNAQNLSMLGVITHIGSYQDWNQEDLVKVIKNRKLIKQQSQRCKNLIDGQGCQRIVDLITINEC